MSLFFYNHKYWEKVVGEIQEAFHKGHLTEECVCQTVILIPKGNVYFRGIGLVEVIWNTVTEILNHCMMAAIQYHDTLNKLFTRIGKGYASLEDKLIQQLMAMREELIYEIFLDIHKAYDYSDCGR